MRSFEWEALLARNSQDSLVIDEIGDVSGSVGGVNGDMFLGQLTTEAEHEHPAKGWWAGGGKQCARTESRPGTGP